MTRLRSSAATFRMPRSSMRSTWLNSARRDRPTAYSFLTTSPFAGLRCRTWHVRDGDRLTDTPVPAAFDAWNHLQLVMDASNESFLIILQIVGEAPRKLCQGMLSGTPVVGESLSVELFCHRFAPNADGPAFDNLRVTRRRLPGGP
jgi:hypothetical protein